MRDRIRGPRGSVVKVTVERASTRAWKLSRLRAIRSRSLYPGRIFLRPGVGYIDMTLALTTRPPASWRRSWKICAGVHDILTDLRNIPADFWSRPSRREQILQGGQLILTQKGRNDQRPYRANTESGQTDTTPLVILVNGNTASASGDRRGCDAGSTTAR